MKVYLVDSKRIQKYILPNKVEESFLITYKDSDEETIITIEAENNKWFLKSNGSTNVLNNNEVIDCLELMNYKEYFLKIIGQNKYLTILTAPSIENNLYKLDYSEKNEITIGSNPKSNIYFKNHLVADNQAIMKKIDNKWFVYIGANLKVGTYVNNNIINEHELKNGDVIFINGLKIIWMSDFIEINNPTNQISVSGVKPYKREIADNLKFDEVTEEENSVELYKNEEYFFHIPFIKERIEYSEVTIDVPPNPENQEELPFFLTIGSTITTVTSTIVMFYSVYSSISSGKKTSDILVRIVMLIGIILGSLLIPKLLKRYQKKVRIKREKIRQTKYKEYLAKKEREINYILSTQARILFDNYPNLPQCENIITKKERNIWNREINDGDFLKIRLGLGNVPASLRINAPEKGFAIETDNLFDEAINLVSNSQELKNIPITLSLVEHNNAAFICNCSYKDNYIDGIMTQILALHSPVDLKLVVFTNSTNELRWDYTKFLSHIWSDDKTTRFFATNSDEYKNVSNYLENIIKQRKESMATNKEEIFPTWYLIITDSYLECKNIPIVREVLEGKEKCGFSLVAISDTMKSLPTNCSIFIELGEKTSLVLGKEVDSQTQQRFTNENLPSLDMRKLGIKLANIPTITKDGLFQLPNSISFLDMYHLSKIEQLNILNRWQTNNPVTSLSAPIGVHKSGEQFKLDLHEKVHGPHGLIAGSTGSGKSEFIITYILSMAINYHPYEVQFVLIDYKGGGLTGAFENREAGIRIPHLVGTITNLDISEMNRTLVSIKSELERRQRIFNETRDTLGEGTIDIYKYQRLYREGVVKEPLAHLFIISDEFAELKSQQPEFMGQLISTSRIGRALGVHLILATQKPSGVVNDQIWSNSKFKVCLKVQDRSDSMEMLKRPDAASLKEVGRFYLQIGYDEYFDIGQSGWAGAKYVPSDKIVKKIDDSINFVNNVGLPLKTINNLPQKEQSINFGEQLTNIVKYLNGLALKENISTKKLWLDPLPTNLYLNNLRLKYNYKAKSYSITPIIGEYDRPTAQEQGVQLLNLTSENVAIYGEPGSGKENLITTIIWSSVIDHTPEEINFYIIDCGAEILKMFYKMPHVGTIATVEETEKIAGIFRMVEEEINKRKDLFADYAGDYVNYCESSNKKLPLIEVIINAYDSFCEAYPSMDEIITSFFRDGSKYGIKFIISTSTPGAIRNRVAQNFGSKVALCLPDVDDYRSILSSPRGLIPANVFGRGLINNGFGTVEFQTAYICDTKQINALIKKGSEIYGNSYKTRAYNIAVIPSVVTLKETINNANGLDSIPLGYDMNTKQIFPYNIFNNHFTTILSNSITDKMDFIYALIKELLKINQSKIKVIDFVNVYTKNINNVVCFQTNFEQSLKTIEEDIQSNQNCIYFLIGISQYKTQLNNDIIERFDNLFLKTYKNIFYVLFDNYNAFKSLQAEEWYQSHIDKSSGIWLGPGVGNQICINTSNMTSEDRKLDFPQMGFVINKGQKNIIKYVIDVDEVNINEK